MSPQEKRWWAYAAIATVVSAIYFAIVLHQASGRPVDAIEFQVPLLIAGATGALLGVLANIVIRVTSARRLGGAPLQDDRDRDIHRLGEVVGGLVLAVAMAVPFALTLLEVHHFWIANAMYLAFTIWALASSAVKLVIYRRGF